MRTATIYAFSPSGDVKITMESSEADLFFTLPRRNFRRHVVVRDAGRHLWKIRRAPCGLPHCGCAAFASLLKP